MPLIDMRLKLENKKLEKSLKTGDEPFLLNNKAINFHLIDFWKWSVSDLVSNATRGRLAEFIVAQALGISTQIPRDEWQAYDLLTTDNVKIEVKSAAYIQSWYQKEYSKISFSIKKSKYWDPETNILSKELTRSSDIYIFALLKHADKNTVNPLDLSQWSFFIVPTNELNKYKRSQTSITLNSLKKITQEVIFEKLREEFLIKKKVVEGHGV